MFELIALIIFLISVSVIGIILYRKIPLLVSLPPNGKIGIRDHRYIMRIENKIKEMLVPFKKQIILHRILSWVKVLVLKFEIWVDSLLHRIRKKAQQIDKELKDKK